MDADVENKISTLHVQVSNSDLPSTSENYEEYKDDLEESSLSLKKVDNVNLSNMIRKHLKMKLFPKKKLTIR